MTLKYILTIEGTTKEIEVMKENTRSFDILRFDTEGACYGEISVQPEYKVVEPLRVEFTTEVDAMSRVCFRSGMEDLAYQLGGNYAGKKVKVVITEEG